MEGNIKGNILNVFFVYPIFKKIILNWERENLSMIKHSQKIYGYHLFKKFSSNWFRKV